MVISIPSIPAFDKKFKIVLKYKYNYQTYPGMLDWINENSKGSIDIKCPALTGPSEPWYAPAGLQRGLVTPFVYIAFEDPDDALFFKIKYSI